LISQYGADATRLGIILSITRDQQAAKFDERNVLAARNFINKLWNINRFISGTIEQNKSGSREKNLSLTDQWILSRINSIILSITSKLENYELGEAAKELYEFAWHEFADWYLEIAKFQIKEGQSKTLEILNQTLKTTIKLLHPFIPFITEEIYQEKNEKNLLMVLDWPQAEKKYINKKIEEKFSQIKEAVTKIRNYRAENKIEPREFIKAPFKLENLQEEEKKIVCELTRITLSL